MTPKEKAEELVNKYEMCTRPIFTLLQYDVEKVYNKECALIAVDEILNLEPPELSYMEPFSKSYWEEVKQEIKKL